MDSGVFNYFDERIFAVLSNDAELIAAVPISNITPTFDKAEKTGSTAVVWGWPSRSYDERTKKGVAQLNLAVSALTRKAADEVYSKCISLLTARSLSDEHLHVGRIREDPPSSTEQTDDNSRNVIDGRWSVLFAYEV